MEHRKQKQQTLAPGTTIGGCRIERLLGRGGMGDVYLAQHLALSKYVAVKILRSGKEDATQLLRFKKEAQMAASVDHPNVVTIHDVGQQDGLNYIVMQFVDGQDLAELVKAQGGSLQWYYAVKLISKAAKGLAAVHNKGMIHRDIKPHNIILSAD